MSDRGKFGLPRKLILKKRRDIETVLKRGRRLSFDYFNVFVYSSGRTGVAFLVSRRIGNAVRRNRMKRLVREGYRLQQEKFQQMELVFFIKDFLDDFHHIYRDISRIN